MVKYFATFVVNSLTSFKNSNAQDKTGITFIVQHVLWISRSDSLEKYMLHHLPYPQPWKKTEYHISGCYFCLADISGYMWKQTLCQKPKPALNAETGTIYTVELLVPKIPETWILHNDVHTHAHITVCVCVYFHFNKHQNNKISVQYSFLGPLFM